MQHSGGCTCKCPRLWLIPEAPCVQVIRKERSVGVVPLVPTIYEVRGTSADELLPRGIFDLPSCCCQVQMVVHAI